MVEAFRPWPGGNEASSLWGGALLVDYRGYGLSSERSSEPGLYRDGLSAYDYCRKLGVAADQLLIHGQSLGGCLCRLKARLLRTDGAAPVNARRLWVVNGAGHNDLRATAGSEYASQLGQFWSDLKSGKFSI